MIDRIVRRPSLLAYQASVTCRFGRRRRGATLLDVAVGSMLLALLLIPSLHLIGESDASHQRVTDREALLFAADQIVEANKVTLSDPIAFAAAAATATDEVTALSLPDVPDVRSRVRIVPDVTAAPAVLLTIDVDVWRDADRDGVIDAEEPSLSLRTQWASP